MSITKTTTTFKFKANGSTTSYPYLVIAHYTDSTDASKHGFISYLYAYNGATSAYHFIPSSFSSVVLASGGTTYSEMSLGTTYARSWSGSNMTYEYRVYSNSANLTVSYPGSSNTFPTVTLPSEPDTWITLEPGTYSYSPTQTCVVNGTTYSIPSTTTTFTVSLPVHVTSGTFSWKNSISYAITDYDSGYSYKLYFGAGSSSNTYNRTLLSSSPSASGTYAVTVSDVIAAWAATSATAKRTSLSSSKTCYLIALAYNSSGAQVGSGYVSLGTVALPSTFYNTPVNATVGSASSYEVGVSATSTAPVGSLGSGTAKPTIYFRQENSTSASSYYNATLSFAVSSTSQSATLSWTPDPTTVGEIITQALTGDLYGSISWAYEVNGTTYTWGSTTWSEKKTLTLPESVYAPTPSIDSITDSEGFYDTYGFAVTGLSQLTVTGSTDYKYSAVEASAGFTFDGSSYSGNEITTNVVSQSGTKSLVYSVTDSRGITRSVTVSISVILWHAPSLTDISVRRGYYSEGVWTQDDNGDYFKLDYTANVSAVNNTNEYTIKITLPESTQTNTYTSDYTATRTVYGHADTESSYTIYFVTTDKYASTSQQYVLSTAGVVLDILSGGKGIGLGKVAEQSKYVDVNSEWTLRAYNIMVGEQTLENYIKSIISETSGS